MNRLVGGSLAEVVVVVVVVVVAAAAAAAAGFDEVARPIADVLA